MNMLNPKPVALNYTVSLFTTDRPLDFPSMLEPPITLQDWIHALNPTQHRSRAELQITFSENVWTLSRKCTTTYSPTLQIRTQYPSQTQRALEMISVSTHSETLRCTKPVSLYTHSDFAALKPCQSLHTLRLCGAQTLSVSTHWDFAAQKPSRRLRRICAYVLLVVWTAVSSSRKWRQSSDRSFEP